VLKALPIFLDIPGCKCFVATPTEKCGEETVEAVRASVGKIAAIGE
jgi:hypothetical protein